MYLENKFSTGCHDETISVGESKCFVIVEHRIQIFNPNCIDGSIQNDPHKFSLDIFYK